MHWPRLLFGCDRSYGPRLGAPITHSLFAFASRRPTPSAHGKNFIAQKFSTLYALPPAPRPATPRRTIANGKRARARSQENISRLWLFFLFLLFLYFYLRARHRPPLPPPPPPPSSPPQSLHATSPALQREGAASHGAGTRATYLVGRAYVASGCVYDAFHRCNPLEG
jgi:hypothetical protein